MSNHIDQHATFLERYLNGQALAEDIDDHVDLWHADTQGKQIYEFLGMSEEEYSLWLRDPDTLPQIALARRTKQPLKTVLETTLKELPIAARSANLSKIDRLMHWLHQKGKLG